MNPSDATNTAYWITPVKPDKEQSAEKVVQVYVGQYKTYAFGDTTPGRKRIKPGDWICFYISRKGVVGHAKVVTFPETRATSPIRNPKRYPWVFDLDSVSLYLEEPVMLDFALRGTLDAFAKKDLKKRWSWFVQTTKEISQSDFNRLTSSRV